MHTDDSTATRLRAVCYVLARLGLGLANGQAVSETLEVFESEFSKKLSRASLYRWLKAYEKGGFDALSGSKAKRGCETLPKAFVDFLKSQKSTDPKASIPEIIRRARASGIIGERQPISRTSAYRKAKELNLPLMRQHKQVSKQRAFAYPHRMQMVLCDGKHFRAGAKRLKRVALFYLDDCSRYVLGVIVGTSESASLFLKGLHKVIARHGLMEKLYMDHGSAFTADISHAVVENLAVTLIHGRVGYPQGHGKVERFNQTCLNQCLRGLDKPGIDADPIALTVRLQYYLDHDYAKSVHSQIKATPLEKFMHDSRELNYPDNDQLERAFVLKYKRKVRNDNIISYLSQNYELPLGYAGKTIQIFHNTITDAILMLHQQKLVRLYPPDLASNARVRRLTAETHQSYQNPDVTNAAEHRFNKAIRPITNADGGFTD